MFRKKNSILKFAQYLFFSLSLFLTVPFGLFSGINSQIQAQTPLRIGVISDSGSDEYRADDNRAGGTPYAATTLNWIELLQKYRPVDFGPWGTRSAPRRTGYAYNWARTAATAGSMISEGQHTGLAAQISSGNIDVVYMNIGSNDFALFMSGGQQIYSGAVSGTALTNKINGVVSNITLAVDTVLAANPNIKIMVTTLSDTTKSPLYIAQYPSEAGRNAVTNAIARANTGIYAMAATRPRVSILDLQEVTTAIFSKIDPVTLDYTIGGEKIHFAVAGNEPHNAILGDSIHAGTVFEGIIANYNLAHLNTMLGKSIPLFSDYEILTHAGINPANQPTPTTPVAPTATRTPTITPSRTPTQPMASATVTSTKTPAPTLTMTCKSDFNNDNFVDLRDYSELVANFLKSPFPNPKTDINQDGRVDLLDYSLFVGNFLKTCS